MGSRSYRVIICAACWHPLAKNFPRPRRVFPSSNFHVSPAIRTSSQTFISSPAHSPPGHQHSFFHCPTLPVTFPPSLPTPLHSYNGPSPPHNHNPPSPQPRRRTLLDPPSYPLRTPPLPRSRPAILRSTRFYHLPATSIYRLSLLRRPEAPRHDWHPANSQTRAYLELCIMWEGQQQCGAET